MVLLALSAIHSVEAQEVPSNLNVVGTISASADDIAPELGDEVLVTKSGETEGSGTVINETGTYLVEMSKTLNFNGTTLSMRIRKSSGTYQLEFGADNTFVYNGGFPFPARTIINPVIGELLDTSGSSSSGGSSGSSSNSGEGYSTNDAKEYDANGDGVFNQADIDSIKEVMIRGEYEAAADVDENNIVNTRDAILAIRKLAGFRRSRTPSTESASSSDDSSSGDSSSDDSSSDDSTETS